MSQFSNGLARPVRAQEPEHLTARDAEPHILHSGPAAEILAQVADLYRRSRGLPASLIATGRRCRRGCHTRIG